MPFCMLISVVALYFRLPFIDIQILINALKTCSNRAYRQLEPKIQFDGIVCSLDVYRSPHSQVFRVLIEECPTKDWPLK